MGSKPFFAGKELTYIDFCMFELIDYMNFLTKEGRIFSKHPKLQQYWTRVERLPKFVDFWADENKCMRGPFNNKHAKINN